jgi:hypothetical protein
MALTLRPPWWIPTGLLTCGGTIAPGGRLPDLDAHLLQAFTPDDAKDRDGQLHEPAGAGDGA